MTGTVQVRHLEGDQFEVAVRQHRFRVDQPVADGGEDTAPTPTELFVSSLAACVAFYVRRFLARHNLSMRELSVEADYSMATRPARVDGIAIRIGLPDDVPDDNRAALLAVARHCTVHNTLETQPTVRIDLMPPRRQAA